MGKSSRRESKSKCRLEDSLYAAAEQGYKSAPRGLLASQVLEARSVLSRSVP